MPTQTKPVTQKQIAQKLGVSHQLVGLALNGHAAVSEQTRQKIIDTAQELGYDRFSNREARSLIARRYGKRVQTGVIAVIVPKMEHGSIRSCPYYPAMLDGIENEANERDLDVLISTARYQGLPRLVQAREVDGVIGLGCHPPIIDMLVELELPIVNLDRVDPKCPSVAPDNYHGMVLAVEYLIGLGHRRIAYMGHPPDNQAPGQRYEGYLDSMKRAGLPIHEELVEATLRSAYEPGGIEGMTNILARTRDFTAVACYNDTIAAGAIKAARQNGLRIPEDVSINGFDDLSSDFHLEPFVTSVNFCRQEMGRRAVQLLCEENEKAMQDVEITSYEPEIVPTELAVRHSTAPPAR